MDLRHAETTTSASQLEAHLQAAPVEQFPENHDIIEQPACQVADGAHNNVPDNTSPNTDAEADLIPMFVDSIRIIPCPEVTVVNDTSNSGFYSGLRIFIICMP
jgi:hypothetical protein